MANGEVLISDKTDRTPHTEISGVGITSTPEFLQAVNEISEGLATGRTLNLHYLGQLLQNYPYMLAQGHPPRDKEDYRNIFAYTSERLPAELFTLPNNPQGKIKMGLYTNPQYFVQGAKKPKSRSRLYKVSEEKEGVLLQQLRGGTDLTEIIIMLGSLEMVKSRCIEDKVVADEIKARFRKVFCFSSPEEAHLAFDNWLKSEVEIYSGEGCCFLRNEKDELVPEPEASKIAAGMARKELDKYIASKSPEELRQELENLQRRWMAEDVRLRERINVEPLVRTVRRVAARQADLNKWLIRARGITEPTEKNYEPDALIFANDFSMRTIIVSGFLLRRKISDEKTIRDRIVELAKASYVFQEREKNKTPLAVLGQQLTSSYPALLSRLEGVEEHKQEMIGFLEDMAIMEMLKSGVSAQFSNELNVSEEDRSKLTFTARQLIEPSSMDEEGITTLVSPEESPIADPIRLIDFTQINKKYIDAARPMVKRILAGLGNKGVRTVLVPYALGDLTYTLGNELLQFFPDIELVAEVGKVGILGGVANGSEPAKEHIGMPVVPTRTVMAIEGKIDDYQVLHNLVSKEDFMLGLNVSPPDPWRPAITGEAVGVLTQTPNDIERVKSVSEDGVNLCTIGMEAFELWRLMINNPGLGYASVDYISDMVSTDDIGLGTKHKMSIAETSGRKTRTGVFMSSLILMETMLRVL